MGNSDTLLEPENRSRITSAEVLILIIFFIIIAATLFSSIVKNKNDVLLGFARISTADLSKFVQDKSNPVDLRVKAVTGLKNRLNKSDFNIFAFESLLLEKDTDNSIAKKLIGELNKRPEALTAQKIAKKYISANLKHKFWDKLKSKWILVSINEALQLSTSLFITVNAEDLRRFRYVVEVLTISGNEHVFNIFNKLINLAQINLKNEYIDVMLQGLATLGDRTAKLTRGFVVEIIKSDYVPNEKLANCKQKLFPIMKQVVINAGHQKHFMTQVKELSNEHWADFIKYVASLKFK